MRRHYESLNYVDAAPGVDRHRFNRTQGQIEGFLTTIDTGEETVLDRHEVESLRDMLNEVLEDWK